MKNEHRIELASNLAHNAAKDEMFKDDLINDEDDMTVDDEFGKGLIYTDEAQEIYNRWYDYFEAEIDKVIGELDTSNPDIIYNNDNEINSLIVEHIYIARYGDYYYNFDAKIKAWVKGDKIPEKLKRLYNTPLVIKQYSK